jgi:hypothetical protein
MEGIFSPVSLFWQPHEKVRSGQRLVGGLENAFFPAQD